MHGQSCGTARDCFTCLPDWFYKHSPLETIVVKEYCNKQSESFSLLQLALNTREIIVCSSLAGSRERLLLALSASWALGAQTWAHGEGTCAK